MSLFQGKEDVPEFSRYQHSFLALDKEHREANFKEPDSGSKTYKSLIQNIR